MNKELFAFELKKQDTLALKGIAIIAMLCHHVYGSATDSSVFVWLGELGKVCIAIFVFCSGYGLSASYPESIQGDNLKAIVKGSFRFEIKRLIKFYSNYWIVFLIFVPISVFVLAGP